VNVMYHVHEINYDSEHKVRYYITQHNYIYIKIYIYINKVNS